jgi:phosphoesterase RecJ-like protein
MKLILDQLHRAKRILLTSHVSPDGDAIGCLLAMGRALELLGKQTTLYNGSSIPAVYRFLPEVKRITGHLDPSISYDTAIVLDCGDLERIGEAKELVERIPVIINIDHHITNTGFGHLQIIDTEACATSEIVYRLIRELGIPLDEAIGYSLYTGILTDTGSFRFSNTNHAAFAICEEMVNIGVNPYQVAQHVYGTYSLGRIKLLNLAIDSIEISDNGKLSVMTLTRNMLEETGTQPEDIDGLINYAKRIEDVKVAALIQENTNGHEGKRDPNHREANFHVSLRSDGSVDVAAIATGFGGGGHPSAAGFSIDATLSDLKLKIIDLAGDL